MDDTDDDPFNYRPLKIKRKCEVKSATQPALKKRRSNSGKKTPIKSNPPGQTLVDLFSTLWKTPEKVISTPKVCPICQLPLDLLQVSQKLHLEDCQDKISTSNLVSRPPCPEDVDCVSREIHHYAKYDHSELARHRDLGFHQKRPHSSSNTRSIPVSAAASIQPQTPSPRLLLTPSLPSNKLPHNPSPSQSPPTASSAVFVSPIKVVRRPRPRCKICEKSFSSTTNQDDHECLEEIHPFQQDAPPSLSPPKLSPERPPPSNPPPLTSRAPSVRRDSADILNSQRTPSQKSADLLAAPTEMNFTQESSEYNLGISKVIETLDEDENIVEGLSQEAGPSVPGPEPVTDVDEEQLDLEKMDIENWSPFKIIAEKDSQELELSLNIDPSVHCTRVRVRVPFNKNAEGESLPLSVSANYTNLKKATNNDSSVKQTAITDFFGGGPKRKEVVEGSNTDSLTLSTWDKEFKRAKAKGFVAPEFDSISDLKKGPNQSKYRRKWGEIRKCPWYKLMKGTSFAVDAFNCGDIPHVTHYILSHFHSDHYMGLSKQWDNKIICSSITMRLAVSKFNIKKDLFITIEPEEERVVAGVSITAVDANHCPGSLMFVMRLTSGEVLLHTGDFRACLEMESVPVLWNTKVDRIYLDTTYCSPEYDLPSQSDVIARAVDLVRDFVLTRPSTAVLCGAYSVGKERIFKEIAMELDSKLWTSSIRVKVWHCLQDKDILGRMVKERSKARVQVVDMRVVGWGGLSQELDKVGAQYNHILGIKPTGWTHSRGEGQESSLADVRIVTKGQLSLLEVPYSEHSSYSELRRFINFLRIGEVGQIVPTVNRKTCKAMEGMFQGWINERKKNGPDSL